MAYEVTVLLRFDSEPPPEDELVAKLERDLEDVGVLYAAVEEVWPV